MFGEVGDERMKRCEQSLDRRSGISGGWFSCGNEFFYALLIEDVPYLVLAGEVCVQRRQGHIGSARDVCDLGLFEPRPGELVLGGCNDLHPIHLPAGFLDVGDVYRGQVTWPESPS